MVVAVLRSIYTTLDLYLFKSKHDCHRIGFEVEKSWTANNTLYLFKSSCLLPEPASFSGDEFRLCMSACVRAASGIECLWGESEGQNLEAPGWWRMGFALPPGSALETDRNIASGLRFSKWVLSASRAVGKLKGDHKVFKWIRKEQIVVNCFIPSIR